MVWEDLFLHAADAGDGYVINTSWTPTIPAGSHGEYVEAMRRFVSSGLLEYLGEGQPCIGKAPFRFRVRPDAIHTMRILERPKVETQQAYIDLIRAVQSGACKPSGEHTPNHDFVLWLEAQEGTFSPATAHRKLYGFNGVMRERRNGGWGIVATSGKGEMQVCWPMFEAITLVTIAGDPKRQRRHKRGRGRIDETVAVVEQPAAKEAPPKETEEPKPAPKESPPPLGQLSGEELDAHEASLVADRERIDAAISAVATERERRKAEEVARLEQHEAQLAEEAVRAQQLVAQIHAQIEETKARIAKMRP